MSGLQSLPAFSDSVAQPVLPTEISNLPEFTETFDLLDSGGVGDLGLDIDLTADLGTQLNAIAVEETPQPGGDTVLSSGNLQDLNLGDLNMVSEALAPVTVKKEPVIEIPQPHPKLPMEPQMEEPQALNLDNINIPDNFSGAAPSASLPSTFKPPSQNAPISRMDTWSIDDVQQWLASKSFGHLYADNFKKHFIDGSGLLRLEEPFMIQELGINKVFHRIRVLRDIADFLQPFSINAGDGGPPYSRLLRFQPYDLKRWIELLPNGSDYAHLFESQNITGEILANQPVNTLKEWGIKNMHAKRYVREINEVRNGVPDAVNRVDQIWNSTDTSHGNYKLLYKHLKPRYRKRTRRRKRKAINQSSDSPEHWGVEEVVQWLEHFEWGQAYAESFRQCQVDGAVLLRLTAQLLEEVFGISIGNQQMEMIGRIDELRSISLRSWLREPQVDAWLRNPGGSTQRPVKRQRVEEEPPQVQPACVLCGKQENIMRCSKCKKAFYCSREHQVAHWPEHASVCIQVP